MMLSEYKTRVGNLFPSVICCVLCYCKAQALIIQVLWEHGVVWKSADSVPRMVFFSEGLLAKAQFLGAHVLLKKPRWRLTSPTIKSIFSISDSPPTFLLLSSVNSCRIFTSFT